MKSCNTCKPLININRHYITSEVTQIRVKLKLIRNVIAFNKVVIKYNLKDPENDSFYRIHIKS